VRAYSLEDPSRHGAGARTAAGVTAMDRIVHVSVTGPCRLFLKFEDGASGDVDLTTVLKGPVLEPLRDIHYLRQVRLGEYGVPAWPNGADLAPDALHAQSPRA